MTRSVPIAQVSSESLRGLPGYWIRSLADSWLEPAELARVVDAPLADLHAEWLAARAAERRVRNRWLALRGNAALLRGLAWFGVLALLASLPRLASIGLGALVFPLGLFWMLALAIEPGPIEPVLRDATIIDLWRKPEPVVLPVTARPRPPKPLPPSDRGHADTRGWHRPSRRAPASAHPQRWLDSGSGLGARPPADSRSARE